jgi:hypothetical protein
VRSKYLLNHLNARGQIQAEINEGPFNAFTRVFLLFQDEHVMVKELLQLLIREVDTQLLETVVLYWYFRFKHGGVRFIFRNEFRGLGDKKDVSMKSWVIIISFLFSKYF